MKKIILLTLAFTSQISLCMQWKFNFNHSYKRAFNYLTRPASLCTRLHYYFKPQLFKAKALFKDATHDFKSCSRFRSLLAYSSLPFASSIFNNSNAHDAMPVASYWQYVTQHPTMSAKERTAQMKELFLNDCKKNAHNNALIPQHTPSEQTVRVATYNVHFFTDVYHKNSYHQIFDTIKTINADVLVLQEVYSKDLKILEKELAYYEYHYFSACSMRPNNKTFFGNIIISKYPFAQQPYKATYKVDQNLIGDQRCYIKAKIQLPGQKHMTIYGTHLDVYDSSEKQRTQELQELVSDFTISPEQNSLIVGDFNSIRPRDYAYTINAQSGYNLVQDNYWAHTGKKPQSMALEFLEKKGFIDSFTKNNQESPRCTTWTGTTVDYMYTAPGWNLPIKKSYVYYGAASDHLPVVMDVGVK
jgi:endonuclease/exonuclease/phosphatase family metal-dependent hydrolase